MGCCLNNAPRDGRDKRGGWFFSSCTSDQNHKREGYKSDHEFAIYHKLPLPSFMFLPVLTCPSFPS